MTDAQRNAPTTPAQPQTGSEMKQAVLKDIGAKWNKFSEHDLSALKGKDDLITQVMSKYSIERAPAQRDVETVLKGRQF